MEFIEGPTYRKVLTETTTSENDARDIMLALCGAMSYAHRKGVIHRDLKPDNILVDSQAGGMIKVADFGVAGFVNGPRFRLTNPSEGFGTDLYVAPEQRDHAKSSDARADIYALGAILYETLTRELPITECLPPSRFNSRTSRVWDGIVVRCMQFDPNDRYQCVSELEAAIESLCL
jgi:serine/threonine protein kinase